MFETSKNAAKRLGLHPNTLRKMADEGKIEHYKTEFGQRRYNVDAYLKVSKPKTTICYCRVSSYKQKDDLQRQVEFMSNLYPTAEIVKDIGSGLNDKRKGLKSVLERAIRGEQLEVVVAYRDRLTRFGFGFISFVIEQNGGSVVVLNQINLSPEEELTTDLLSILHVFSCRMHGLRNYKNEVSKALSEQGTEQNLQPLDSCESVGFQLDD